MNNSNQYSKILLCTLLFLFLVSSVNARIQDWPRAGQIRYRPSYQLHNRDISQPKDRVKKDQAPIEKKEESIAHEKEDESFLFSQLYHDWLKSGEISFRPSYQISNNPITDPTGEVFGSTESHGRLYGLFKLEKSISDFRIISQIRPRLDYVGNEMKFNTGVDELYADYAITPATFIGIGKRNIFSGVGLGTNFTDYFGENKEVDLTLDEASRRDQRKGDYMLSFDWFFDAASFSMHFAPRMGSIQKKQTRLLLNYNYFFTDWNSDISSYFFIGERPGVGFNFSKSMNDNWILYSELSFRDGRDKLYTNALKSNKDVYSDGLIGSNYAFDNGLNVYFEYWRNSSGYRQKEWRHFLNETQVGIDHFRIPNDLLGLPLLGRINGGLRPRLLRKNYLFSRLSYSVDQIADLSLVYVYNIDDSSQFLRALIEREFSGKYSAGFQIEQFIGHDDEEFGMRPASTNFTLYLKTFF
ncbi:MAG: hypothetical protein KAH20_03915 [Methylococcales bacterium]|nr:hypothetical protein [Methylococcales bacterium]